MCIRCLSFQPRNAHELNFILVSGLSGCTNVCSVTQLQLFEINDVEHKMCVQTVSINLFKQFSFEEELKWILAYHE